MGTSNKENSDSDYDSSTTRGETSADYIIRGADEDRTVTDQVTSEKVKVKGSGVDEEEI